MAAPMPAPELYEKRFTLLGYAILLFSFYESLIAEGVFKAFLLCRHCGHEIAQPKDFIHMPSVYSKRQRNDTILGVKGVLIQLFENPAGNKFEVITAKSADVQKLDEVVSTDTWFPGYAWRITLCPRCGFHIGWSYEGDKTDASDVEQTTFFGLILSSVIQNDYADSLLVTPKAYRS